MKLTIFSPAHKNTYDVTYVEVETSVGNFVILEGHEPLLLIIKAGSPLIFCRTSSPDSQETQELAHGGILKVTRDEVLLLIG